MAQQARDEAGNIWNIDEAGNPVSLAQAAPQGGASVVAPNPVQAQRQGVELGGAQLSNQRTAQQIAIEAARAPYAPRQAAADTTKAEIDAEASRLALEKSRREVAAPDTNVTKRENLQRAINTMRKAFAAGPLRTKGLAGLTDYLPSDANGLADDAGNAAAALIGPALNLSASQLNTPGEVARAVGPYIPQSSDRDARILAKIQRLQGMADSMGGPQRAPQQQMQGQQAQNAMMIPGAGTMPPQPPQGPAGYDVGSVAGAPSGGTGGGGNFASAAGVAMAKKLSDAYTRGAGVQQLNTLLADNGFQTFSDPATIAAIQKRGRLNFAPPVADDTRGAVGKALGGLADSAGGAYAISAADALTAGTLDNIAGGQSGLAMDYARQQYPGASLAGTVTGGALAAGGAELGLARAGLGAGAAALGGDALYGAAYGAGSTEDGSRLLGAAGGGLGGLAGGYAGRGLARGAAGLLRGVQDPSVQLLRAQGVPMTAGQALSQSGRLGAAVKTAEDLTTGLPGVGTMTNARRLEGFEGFNRAAFNEAAAPIAPVGARPNWATDGVIREQGIDAAQNRVGDAYSNALDNVQLQADLPFTADMRSTLAAGRALPEPMAGNANYTLNTRIGNSFDNTGGLTGRDFQQSIRGLRQDASSMADLPYGHDFGQVTRQGESGLEGLLDRQSPGTLPAYRAANSAYRNTEILRDAVNRARVGTRVGEPGVFAPSQLADAAAANSRKFGNSQGTTRQPFFDLTRAGQRVLTSKVADSGTAGRVALTAGLTAAGGGGYATGGAEGAAQGAGGTLALAGLLAAGGSKVAQRQAVKLLLDRPEMLIRAGNGIANRARIGGLFGAPMLAGGGASLATQ